MRTTKTDRLSDYGPLDPWPYRALTLAQGEMCTACAAQGHRILNLQAEAEAQRHRYRTTMLGALLAVLLLIATVITGAVTAVPKHPLVAPPAASECHTDSECEGLPAMEWGDI